MNGGTITFKFTGDTKELDKSVDKVKSNVTSKMASIGSAIGKGVAVGVGAATTALAAFSKASVSAFADYEQLTGGVSTLFGTRDAKNVEEYAKLVGKSVSSVEKEYNKLAEAEEKVMVNAYNGYKTAGLSVNQYMETVNSFAASLKQSVNDPIKLAKAADIAVTDMADNANKMGTSMEAIQNAYQGFAKQNYTMLD